MNMRLIVEQISTQIEDQKKPETPENKTALKTRAMLTTAEEHPLSNLLIEMKKRGVKNFDASSLVLDAINTLEDGWWEEKLEDLTPLEYKISSALTDPEMREKLTQLLSSQTLDSNTTIH